MQVQPHLRHILSEDEKDKDQRLFAFEMQDECLKVGLLSNKAIAIAKSISNIFQQKAVIKPPPENECQTCQSKFIMFFKKRVLCAMCGHSFCQK